MQSWFRDLAARTQARPALPPDEVKNVMLSWAGTLGSWDSAWTQKLPIPRDLKEPEGWKSSSFMKTRLLERVSLDITGKREGDLPSDDISERAGLNQRRAAPWKDGARSPGRRFRMFEGHRGGVVFDHRDSHRVKKKKKVLDGKN